MTYSTNLPEPGIHFLVERPDGFSCYTAECKGDAPGEQYVHGRCVLCAAPFTLRASRYRSPDEFPRTCPGHRPAEQPASADGGAGNG